jgi:hypothetical protein
MLASFKLKTKELGTALKLFKVALKLKASNKLNLICEVTIKDNQIDLCVPGVLQTVICETDGTAKFVMPYLQLEYFVKSFRKQEIAELRDKLSRASLLTSQVNTFHVLIHSSSSSLFHSVMHYSIHFARLLVI